jgi:uncharacterized protein YjdB
LENKLGAANVHYDRAVDTVAFKAPNGAYLEAADNAYSDPGASSAGGGYPPASPDTPIKATGTPGGAVPTASDTALLFEHYDFGELTQLLRTPVNDRFVQVPHTLNAAANAGLMVNNTSQPGQATLVGGNTQYVNYQTFRVVGTPDGKVGIYNQIAGNGGNNAYGESAMAYDQDDEDLNNGSYLALAAGDVVKADTGDGHVGPFRNEQHTVGPDITQAPFDRNGNDKLVDSLPNEFKFDMQVVESNTEAIAAQVAAAGAGAPIIMVVGYDPHLNAREAVDLQETGLSAQQTENIDYVTNTLGRDVILVVKTGSPMTIDATVHNNPRVKAILEIGHSGQEEGSALVAAMFDDGYRVPASGFAPAASKYSPYASYSAYPGYLPAGRRVIPAFSPAGRLSATWYAAVEDMIGASEDNPPASYRWPAYDESTNDNLSNMNGTVPKGLMTYDIIKGERTYQYFNGTPLYEFGYGLTYTDFAYTTAVSPLVGGKFTVSGTVRNTGSVASDEVVQVYSTYAGSPSRIDQANRRLIAFDRIKSIAPGETRSFSFAVDAADKIGVWDVERSAFIIEPGPYTIAVGPSSSAAAATATLNVTAGGGGQGAGTRDLTKQTLAEKFDDYSNISKDASDIELVSTSDELHSSEAVWLRQAGAWVNYQDVAIKPGTDTITVRAGADRAGSLKVFALPAGSPVSALAAATPVATIPLADTRPVSGLATGLGIGPIAVRNSPFAGHQYPGSPQGQNNLDASGNPYKDAYVTPEYKVEVATAALQAGTWDIYVQSQARGARIDWVKLGADADKTSSVAISQLYSAGSIRSKGGEVQFDAKLTPASSASTVTWSVAAPGGGATGLATISAKGLLRATGTANGTVVVTATSNGKKATLTVPVTNQLASNRVAIGGVNKTVEYPMMRTGAAFGAADAISHPKGSLAQSVVFSELFSENMASFYLPGTLLTVPVRELDWSIAGTDGLATRLATVDHLGVVQATGVGDGEVVVTASLKNNPDIEVSRTITLTNQAGRNPFRMVQTENYDDYSPALAIPPGSFMPPAVSLSIWGGGGNEAGTAARTQAGTTVAFKGMDFRGVAASEFAIRLATDQAGTAVPFTVQVWADATSAGAGGTLLATVSDTTDTSTAIYHTYKASVGSPLTGKRDVYLVFDAGLRVNWWTFATGSRIDDEAAGLLASAKAMVKGDNPAAAWSEFTGARDALAAALAASGTSQKALDQAQDKLVKALGGVTAVPVADVSALGAAIAAAEALVQADYTPASWTAVAQALSAAKAIQSSAHPVQSEVDAAVAALVRAIGGLQSAGTAAALTAAKSALTQLVAAAGALAEAEASYTAETWKAFATTLAEAQRVLADPAASPDQLAAANAALAAAMSGLVRIKVDSSAVPQVKPLTALRISQKSIRLVKGSTARPLAVAYNEDGAAGLKATWKSSKPKIVKVNTKTGKLRAVKNGTATVTATVKDASGKALKVSIKVTVVSKKVKAKSVSAAVPKTLKVGATKALAAKVTSTKATGAQVRFSSSNPQVLDVDGAGLITAKKAGKATIKVTAAGKSKSYKVTVK